MFSIKGGRAMKKVQKEAIDELAEVRKQMKPLAKREKELKEILSPLGLGVHRGIRYYLVIEEGSNSHFDSDALKAAIPKVLWEPFWVTTDYIKLGVKPMAPVKSEAKAA
jgi:hypothetical protein